MDETTVIVSVQWCAEGHGDDGGGGGRGDGGDGGDGIVVMVVRFFFLVGCRWLPRASGTKKWHKYIYIHLRGTI